MSFWQKSIWDGTPDNGHCSGSQLENNSEVTGKRELLSPGNTHKSSGFESNESRSLNRYRKNEILFIVARNEGHLINRRTLELSEDDIRKVAETYHAWRSVDGAYEDTKGFCNSASLERVRELDYVLTPGRYVGLPDEEDDLDFNERFSALKAEFEEQLKEEERLNRLILENLDRVKLV